ncbi:MAG: hypothetical protein U1D35_17250 [Paracoccaceae bacterium]|nr:hypothetical protein [Paracoccaceae bacterium]
MQLAIDIKAAAQTSVIRAPGLSSLGADDLFMRHCGVMNDRAKLGRALWTRNAGDLVAAQMVRRVLLRRACA